MLGAALLLVSAMVPARGSAETIEELRDKQKRVREQKAALAAQIDVIKATDDEVSAALDALEENVSGQEAVVEEARARFDAAQAGVDAARADLRALEARITGLKAELAKLAVDAYIRPPTDDLFTTLSAGSPNEAAQRQALLDLRAGRNNDVSDELRAANEDMETRRREAEAAELAAARTRDELEGQLADLQAARDQQQAVVDEVEAKLERALSEAQGLASLDRNIGAQITAKQEEIARKLRDASARVSKGTGASPAGPISLTSVYGITVNTQIADNVKGLLESMTDQGFHLGGGGYRSTESQISLRRAHCGSSQYAIWEMPSTRCRPPTARPGQSMHERGLAIDFTCGGVLITSRSTACYRALAATAPRYGLYGNNLEAWHWSTNGN